MLVVLWNLDIAQLRLFHVVLAAELDALLVLAHTFSTVVLSFHGADYLLP